MMIRYMEETDDRMAIGRIYRESWKYAYQGIIPQNYLESISAGQWVEHLEEKGRHTLLMIENHTFIGTSSYSASRYKKLDGFGEIVSIYLLPEYMGKGYGKQLLAAAVDGLAQLGYRDIFLWVLEENRRARKFYENAGFLCSGDYLLDYIGGKELREVQYCRHI